MYKYSRQEEKSSSKNNNVSKGNNGLVEAITKRIKQVITSPQDIVNTEGRDSVSNGGGEQSSGEPKEALKIKPWHPVDEFLMADETDDAMDVETAMYNETPTVQMTNESSSIGGTGGKQEKKSSKCSNGRSVTR